MLTVIGECLVDVVETGTAAARAHVGGSPLNVAVGLARLGHPAQFVGRYGRDEYGQMIHSYLKENSVIPVLPADERSTSVATATLDPSGAARYTFDLDWELPGLDRLLPRILDGTEILHTGSIATMLEPGAASVLHAVETAHPAATISFDPNCRPTLITDREYARPRTERFG
jgi:fructokinase